ncbi:aminotransferase class V-fold PLP-dependent enzyme [Actinomycetospora sp. CA-101289]|uniref:aminotransferase class V-fold PLP-dependent enzyme n=1 Tax=Actinomycetospora sp. CA-101289 TaxID=3239893 RepID=UPI003D964B34
MLSNSSPEPGWAREQFALPRAPDEGDAVYLAGNSLGAQPHAARRALLSAVDEQWAAVGVAGWEDCGWWEAPRRLGDRIAPLVGAAAGQVVVGDSTSVQLFGLLVAAARLRPDRTVLLSDAGHFPTDRYLAISVARLTRLTLETASPAAMAPDGRTAVVAVPAVDFRTGERWDLGAIVARAHEAGAVVVADLSHAAGVVPVELDALGVDLAVGCTYKYLNGGPGAPAFAYVAERHHDVLDPPLTGWTGHADPFAMTEAWTPAPGVGRLRVGTPPMLGLLALDGALDVFDGVDLAGVHAASLALGDAFLADLPAGVEVVTPREQARRGGHVAVRVGDAQGLCAALARRGVVVDARPPDLLRFGFAAPYVTLGDARTAARELAALLG